MVKTFTVKLEGKDTKIEVDDKITVGKVKKILKKGMRVDSGTGKMELDPMELFVGFLSAVVVKPKMLQNPVYVDNLDALEYGAIMEEVQKIIPFEKFSKIMEVVLGQDSSAAGTTSP